MGGRLAGGEWTGHSLECQAREVDMKVDRALRSQEAVPVLTLVSPLEQVSTLVS